jgi:hypothetical protein
MGEHEDPNERFDTIEVNSKSPVSGSEPAERL